MQFGEALFKRVHNLHRIDARLPANVEQHRRGALVVREGAALAHAVLHLANVFDADRRAFDVLHDDAVKVLDRLHSPHRAYTQLGDPLNDAPARRFHVLSRHGALNLLRTQVVRIHFVDIEKDVDLAIPTALHVDDAHTIDSLNRTSHSLVGDLGQVADGTRARQRNLHDGVGIEVALGNCRGQSVGRQFALRRTHLLAHIVDGFGDVAVKNEVDLQVRVAFSDSSNHFVNACDGSNRLLHREHDLAHHFLRAGTGQADSDVDRRDVGLGEEIDTEVGKAERAHHNQEHDEHQRKHRTLDTNFA